MWNNSLGEKGQGDCMCTLVLIRDNRVEGRGGFRVGGHLALTGVVEPPG